MKDSKDYFLAGRSLTWWVIGLSIIGTNIGTNSYIGASGNAYSIGIAQANFEWIGAIPAMIICSLIFIPLYWKAGVYSIPEYLGLRYNQPVRLVAALIACIVREREVFVPRGTDEVLSGDVVVVFTVPEVREEVLRLFRDPKEEASPS